MTNIYSNEIYSVTHAFSYSVDKEGQIENKIVGCNPLE